jgi:hypothetical protein
MSKLPLGDWKALNDGEMGPGGRGTRPTLGEADRFRGGGGSTINGTTPAPSGLCDLDSDEGDGEPGEGRSAMVMRGDRWMAGIFLVGPLPPAPRDELLRPTEGELVCAGW